MTSDYKLRFPLKDVEIRITDTPTKIADPLFCKDQQCSAPDEFSMYMEGAGWLYTQGGNRLEFAPDTDAQDEIIEILVGNWGLVSLLHQRKWLNFHASAFALNEKGIMVCGDSGAGKSSLTAGFCAQGATFMNDDVTVIEFNDSKPMIRHLSTKMALTENTLSQLPNNKQKWSGVNPFNQKKWFEQEAPSETYAPLDHVLWIVKGKTKQLKLTELEPMQRFILLRGEICGWEMLAGMKETEAYYLHKLLEISQNVQITRVDRPEEFPLNDLIAVLYKHMSVF
ncbi:hypothetical protein [Maribellus mangrovi]|uniref:hypothetical protein n=1 Tax=Maribellus mangrovi TaxID=3133146 RepID=UPI0030EBFF34